MPTEPWWSLGEYYPQPPLRRVVHTDYQPGTLRMTWSPPKLNNHASVDKWRRILAGLIDVAPQAIDTACVEQFMNEILAYRLLAEKQATKPKDDTP
jgi:hypothetical protein